MKYLHVLVVIIMILAVAYNYHEQIAGNKEARQECTKIGGVLWSTITQGLVCFKPELK